MSIRVVFLLGVVTAVRLSSGAVVDDSPRMTPLVRVVRRVMPTVVNINTTQPKAVEDHYSIWFDEFFGVRRYRRQMPEQVTETVPLGSGIIVDRSGLVMTNAHVVLRGGGSLQVLLWNGRSCEAVPVAVGATNDLALLRVVEGTPTDDFRAIDFATPDDLLLGETVAAIGNPFGLGHSVSEGVLSATGRRFVVAGSVEFNDILQTTAAINPGNSGGPLVNMDGELIAMNVAVRPDAEGIGYAIPLRRIEDVLAGWLVPSRFSLQVCGFAPRTVVEEGRCAVVVGSVEAQTPASESRLEEGMRITAINGIATTRALDVGRILWRLGSDDAVRIETVEAGTVTLNLARMDGHMLVRRRLGIQLQEITKPLRTALGIPEEIPGMAVSEVLQGTDFEAAGVRRGDIVYGLGQRVTNTVQDVYEALRDVRPGDEVRASVLQLHSVNGRLFLRELPSLSVVTW